MNTEALKVAREALETVRKYPAMDFTERDKIIDQALSALSASAEQPEDQGEWIDVRKRQPERGQRIQGLSRSGAWIETFDPDEPLGHMTHWRAVADDATDSAPQASQPSEVRQKAFDRLRSAEGILNALATYVDRHAPHPAPAQTAPVNVPPGYKVVPVNPPRETRLAVYEAFKELQADDTQSWPDAIADKLIEAYLAAAPSVSVEPSMAKDAGWISVEDRLPETGVEVLINGQEGVESASYYSAKPDSVDEMGHDAGWIGYKFAMTGRSFGNPDYMREPQGQPTHWMPLPSAPLAATAQQKGGE